MKRLCFVLALALTTAALLTAASPLSTPSINIVHGLPGTLNIGDVDTVIVQVNSTQEYLQVQAMPSFAYPGKGVVAVQGGDHAGRGTSAVLKVTFEAKTSTAKMVDGVAPVHVVVGVRYPGGSVAVEDYVFYVAVP